MWDAQICWKMEQYVENVILEAGITILGSKFFLYPEHLLKIKCMRINAMANGDPKLIRQIFGAVDSRVASSCTLVCTCADCVTTGALIIQNTSFSTFLNPGIISRMNQTFEWYAIRRQGLGDLLRIV